MREERSRIERSNGTVRQSIKGGRSVGVQRVWVKGQEYPGLAMSRSLGDKLAQNVGVSCDPSVKQLLLDFERFNYLVVNGSDGLWDAMTDQIMKEKVLTIFRQEANIDEVAKELARESREEWVKNDDLTIDDITVQILRYF